ncbi:MAG: histidine--tRNA ligase [Alphaproteobacteria bacterium]
MSKLQRIRGFRDLLPSEAALHRYIRDIFYKTAHAYGFGEISLPIMEDINVFARGLGDSSDVVSKEMFLTAPRDDESGFALRPEGTAGVVRAVIENGLQQSTPLKLYYEGPMFRYERPQKGRYRQFWQSGAELIGVDNPLADVEMIGLAWQIMKNLGIDNQVEIQINTLGDTESRNAYREALVGYLSQYEDELSVDSKVRLHKNPMRILDSKDAGDKKIVSHAPKMDDYLTEKAKTWFADVCAGLDALNIPWVRNPLLVRGLDYYTHTAFEFVSTDESMGAQSTILAGGRYDGLVKQLGGSQVPGVGWAAGIDRLALIFEDKDVTLKPTVMIPMGEDANKMALNLVNDLRAQGFIIDQAFGGNMKKRLNKADKSGAKFALILGDDELSTNQIIIRNLKSGEQIYTPILELPMKLAELGADTV